MARSKRDRAKNRRSTGLFVAIPIAVLESPNFLLLTAKAIKLLIDLTTQLKFKEGGSCNNGDLTVALSRMEDRGWKSKETLWNAVRELEHYGFIKQSRQGGRHRCSLYAITWLAIDECNGKLDIKPTSAPSNEWKKTRSKFVTGRKKRSQIGQKINMSAPNIVRIYPANRVNEGFLYLKTAEIWALCPENRTSQQVSLPRQSYTSIDLP